MSRRGSLTPRATEEHEEDELVPVPGTSPNALVSDLYRPKFLPDLLIAALARNGDRPAVQIGAEMRTAAEVGNEISRYVQALRAQGVELGSGVATLSKNRVEVLYSMGAVMVGGYRNTPLHPLGSLDDHAYVLEDAGIDTLLFDPSFSDRARDLSDRLPGLRRLLSFGEADVGDDLMRLAATFAPQALVSPAVDAEDLSALAYTGGTTGKPKGVMNTYRGSAPMAQLMVSELQWPEEVRHLVCTPLSHAGSSLFVPLQLQSATMFVLPTFEAGAVLEAIERHRITTTMLVPSMIYALLDHPRFAETDLSSLQTVFYGASAMSPARLQEAITKLGPIFVQFYGQTEVPMTVCVLRKEDHDINDLERLTSCGRPVPWVPVALLDDDGKEVPVGEPGELCVRGPLVMKGYWNKPEETAEAFEHGWLHTGDVCPRGRGRLLHDRRPQEGHDRVGWLQRLPPRDRGRDLTHPSIAAGRRGRRSRREVGRGGEGGRGPSGGPDRRPRGSSSSW